MTIGNSTGFFNTQVMFICDQQTLEILDVNDVAVRLLGYSKKDIIGKKLLDFARQESSGEVLNALLKNKKFGDNKLWYILSESGEKHFFQFSATLIHFQGKPAKFVLAHDVSRAVKNKVMKHVLSRPLGIHNFPLAEIEWDASLKILRWSGKAEKLFGWEDTEVINTEKMYRKIIHPDDFSKIRDIYREAFKKKKNQLSIVCRNYTREGKIIYCEWNNSLLYDDNGQLSSIYSLTHEVTDREEAFEYAKKSTKSYQDLFNSIGDAIYLINPEGNIVETNKGLEKTFGYRREDVLNRHFKMLSAPGKFHEERFEELAKHAREGISGHFTGWGKKKNGEIFQTELTVNKGNYYGEDVLIVVERDISEQKAHEKAMKKREELLSKLFNSSPIGIALLNVHKEVEMINEGFEHLFGWREEEIKGLELDRVIVPKNQHENAARLSESEKVVQVTDKRVRKDGKLLDVIIYVVPVIVDSKVVAIYGIYVDITRMQEAEEKIKKSLKEKELMLAEIHHRVKNNLAVISGLLELQSYSAESKSAKRILRESQMRVNSIALVHEKLYQTENFTGISLDQYFEDLVNEIHRSMKTASLKVDIKLDIEPVELPINKAIPCGLLVNEIITNSFKHAFDGREKGVIRLSLKKNDEQEMTLKIGDDGIGMPEQKDADINSSLGMSLIQTLTKQLGADTQIKSNGGVSFEIRFTP